jgi:hypothetical protein
MHHLAQALIPVAGIGVFLGLSSTTLALLRAEGLALPWINDLRLTLLMGANIWALWLAWQIARTWALNVPRALLCILPFLAVLVWNDTAWAWLFWWW